MQECKSVSYTEYRIKSQTEDVNLTKMAFESLFDGVVFSFSIMTPPINNTLLMA